MSGLDHARVVAAALAKLKADGMKLDNPAMLIKPANKTGAEIIIDAIATATVDEINVHWQGGGGGLDLPEGDGYPHRVGTVWTMQDKAFLDRTTADGIYATPAGVAVAIAAAIVFGGTGVASTIAHSDHNHDSTYAALQHTHTASQIVDATVAGRALLTATDAPAQRTTLGLTGWATKAYTNGSTTDVAEGANLYYTDTRARAAISGTAPISVSAGVITHLGTDGYMHVPATSTTNSGRALVAGSTAGSAAWTQLTTAHVSGLTGWATKTYTNGSTTDVAEGVNLYYTDARARAACTPAAIGAVASTDARYIFGDNGSGTRLVSGTIAALTKSGFYCGLSWSDAPVPNTHTHLIRSQYASDGGSSNAWSFDIAANFGSAATPGSPENYYVRCIAASASTGWRKLWHDGNLTPAAIGAAPVASLAGYLPLSGGNLAGNLRPNASNSYELGSTSLRWANVYGINGDFVNLSVGTATAGSFVRSGGTAYQYLRGDGSVYTSANSNGVSRLYRNENSSKYYVYHTFETTSPLGSAWRIRAANDEGDSQAGIYATMVDYCDLAKDSQKLGGVVADNFVQGSGQGLYGHRTTNVSAFDVLFKSGFYDSNSATTGPFGATWTHLIRSTHTDPTNVQAHWSFDIAAAFIAGNTENYAVRANAGAAWGAWRTLWHSGNLTPAAIGAATVASLGNYLPLTGGSLSGSLSGTTALFSGLISAAGDINTPNATCSLSLSVPNLTWKKHTVSTSYAGAYGSTVTPSNQNYSISIANDGTNTGINGTTQSYLAVNGTTAVLADATQVELSVGGVARFRVTQNYTQLIANIVTDNELLTSNPPVFALAKVSVLTAISSGGTIANGAYDGQWKVITNSTSVSHTMSGTNQNSVVIPAGATRILMWKAMAAKWY